MQSILLIRHGQASLHGDDYDVLSPTGHEQATLLGNHLKARLNETLVWYHGNMRRHRETLNALTAPGGCQCTDSQELPGLNEYDHEDILGQYHPELSTAAGIQRWLQKPGMSKAAFMQTFVRAIERWIDDDPSHHYQERWSEFRLRVLEAFATIQKASQPDAQAVVVTSGGVISLIVASLLGMPEKHMVRLNASLVNCGVTKILLQDGRARLSCLNNHSVFEHTEHQHLITYA